MMIMRGSAWVVVPHDYESWPEHQAVVQQLHHEATFEAVVKTLEDHAISWIAADVLQGREWVRRYLMTMAKMSQQPATEALGRRAYRALCAVLTGVPVRRGRRKADKPSGEAMTAGLYAVAKWREIVKARWGLAPSAFVLSVHRTMRLSRSYQAELLRMKRKPSSRWRDVALTLASWETGVPIRTLRAGVSHLVDFVHG